MINVLLKSFFNYISVLKDGPHKAPHFCKMLVQRRGDTEVKGEMRIVKYLTSADTELGVFSKIKSLNRSGSTSFFSSSSSLRIGISLYTPTFFSVPLSLCGIYFFLLLLTSWSCSGSTKAGLDSGSLKGIPCTSGKLTNLAQSKISLNVACATNFEDTNPPITFAFPSHSKTKALPDISLLANETDSTTYFTLDDTTPSETSATYSTPLAISASTSLRYFSKDILNNLEQPKQETYDIDPSLASLTLQNLSASFVNAAGSVTLDVVSDESGIYTVELGGNGEFSNGSMLSSGNLTASVADTITINGIDLINGSNQIYVYFAGGSGIAYTSFYVYRDDQAPFVQATPDQGSFKFAESISLKTTEPVTIYYTSDITGATPPDPTTASTVYDDAAMIPMSGTNGLVVVNTIKYFAVDLAGNQSDIVTKVFKVDIKKPVFTTISVDDSKAYAKVPGTPPYFLSQNAVDLTIATLPTSTTISAQKQIDIEWQPDEDVTYSIEINASTMGTGTILRTGTRLSGVLAHSVIEASEFVPSASQFLKIFARDSVGNTEEYQIQVIVDNAVVAPKAVSPIIGGFQSGLSVNFSFTDMTTSENPQGAGIDQYEIQVASNLADFSTFAGTPVLQTFSAPVLINMASAGKYYWRVASIDYVGNRSYSQPRSFYVGKAANDVDGLGNTDLLVGAPGASSNLGKAYLYRGEDAGYATNVAPHNVADIIFSGTSVNGQFGHSVTIAHDLDSDGLSDVIISAPYADPGSKPSAGIVYIFLGKTIQTTLCPAGLAVATPCAIAATSADVILSGENGGDEFGSTTAYAGDVNKDGYGDYLIGSPKAQVGAFVQAGKAYLYQGAATLSPTSVITIGGNESAGGFSSCLSSAGDMNGDGYFDFIIGANQDDAPLAASSSDEGMVYFFYGSNTLDASFDQVFLGPQDTNALYGSSCARAYDLDGDGFEDIVAGAPGDDGISTDQGKGYIHMGGGTIMNNRLHNFSASAMNGQFSSSVIGAYFDSETQSSVLLGAKGLGSVYSVDGSTVCNPDVATCSVTTSGTVANTVGAISLGSYGPTFDQVNTDVNRQDLIAVGDPNNAIPSVYIYYNALTTPVSTLTGDGADLTDRFGFSISRKP